MIFLGNYIHKQNMNIQVIGLYIYQIMNSMGIKILVNATFERWHVFATRVIINKQTSVIKCNKQLSLHFAVNNDGKRLIVASFKFILRKR